MSEDSIMAAALADQSAEPVLSVAGRIERERQRIMRGISIISVCSAATASMYADDDPERMREALLAAHDIFTSATEELERIAKAVDAIQKSP